MLQPFRDSFNASFTPAAYADLRSSLNAQTGTEIQFRICETPCFFPPDLLDRMVDAGRDLTLSLLGNPAYMQASNRSIPELYRVPNESRRPHFMTVDFGFVHTPDGHLDFKLVELQAFPSIFGFQTLLAPEYMRAFSLDPSLRWIFGGHTETSYWDLLRDVIVGRHDPENVVLLEVTPEQQKTLPDFRVYEQKLGIATVDIAEVQKRGNRLFYTHNGKERPIHRIFNRAIVDEIERKSITPGFSFRDDLDVEWAGHPNWYFRLSKFSLPYLTHPTVPKAVFLDAWFDGDGRHNLPSARSEILLKPLFSFAGKGIQFAPTDADLAAIPPPDRPLYLLQERVHFVPVIATPAGPTQAEVRIMYVWPDGDRAELTPMTSLVRLGRGLMMGVDHNREQSWVGGSAALFPAK